MSKSDHSHPTEGRLSTKIEAWLSDYVDSDGFRKSLEHDIDSLDKASERVKVRMELLSYVVPAVKGVDPTLPDQRITDITINYVEAKPPKKSKHAPPS